MKFREFCAIWLSAAVIASAASCPVVAQNRTVQGFSEVAAARGLNFTAAEPSTYGHGVAFVDLDGDGDADIVCLGGADGVVGVFENDGAGFFTDRSADNGLPLLPKAQGVVAADFDRDGLLDLYISRSGGPGTQIPNALIRNLGDFQFEVLAETGTEIMTWSDGCAWADFDHDGWMDLAVPRYLDETNFLFRNTGDGTFEDATVASGFDVGIDRAFQIAFFDMDLDGDSDAYIASDARTFSCDLLGFRNSLLENVGGTFINISEGSGADICLDSMSIAIGDFSGNGFSDLFITNTPGGHALLRNNGDNTFDEVAAEAGVDHVTAQGWGAVFFDYDNDGMQDLYVCLMNTPNALFKGGTWPVSDVANAMNVDTGGLSFTVAVADVDQDGDVDFVVQNLFEPIRLYINNLNDDANWARFDVVGMGDDRFAIGSFLQATAGGSAQLREVIAGSNFKSQNELIQHFGLGDAAVIEELVITWPGGDTRTLLDVPANHTWTIYPLDKCGDVNADGVRDFTDYLAFAACYSGSDPTDFSPGCELFDYQGDCDVDLADFDMFLDEYADPLIDCNNNGIPDLREILEGTAPDNDNDGLIDGCVPASDPAPGDVTGDGSVDLADLLAVISTWGCAGCTPDCTGDANDDCEVNLADLLLVISNWGS